MHGSFAIVEDVLFLLQSNDMGAYGRCGEMLP